MAVLVSKRRCTEVAPVYYRLLRVWPLVPPTFRPPREVLTGLDKIYTFLKFRYGGVEPEPLRIDTVAVVSSLYVPSILYRLQ